MTEIRSGTGFDDDPTVEGDDREHLDPRNWAPPGSGETGRGIGHPVVGRGAGVASEEHQVYVDQGTHDYPAPDNGRRPLVWKDDDSSGDRDEWDQHYYDGQRENIPGVIRRGPEATDHHSSGSWVGNQSSGYPDSPEYQVESNGYSDGGYDNARTGQPRARGYLAPEHAPLPQDDPTYRDVSAENPEDPTRRKLAVPPMHRDRSQPAHEQAESPAIGDHQTGTGHDPGYSGQGYSNLGYGNQSYDGQTHGVQTHRYQGHGGHGPDAEPSFDRAKPDELFEGEAPGQWSYSEESPAVTPSVTPMGGPPAVAGSPRSNEAKLPRAESPSVSDEDFDQVWSDGETGLGAQLRKPILKRLLILAALVVLALAAAAFFFFRGSDDAGTAANNDVTGNEAVVLDATGEDSAPAGGQVVEEGNPPVPSEDATGGDGSVESVVANNSAPWNYYGNPWVPNSLANLTVEGSYKYSYRFVAKHSGVMNGFQNYMQANTSRLGYAQGDGGSIRFRLTPDGGAGLPDESQVLAEVVWRPELLDGSGLPAGSDNYTDSHPKAFADKYWSAPVELAEGVTYHIVVDNVSEDPNGNYISINNPYSSNGYSRSPLAPPTSHWGITQNTGEGWLEYTEPFEEARYEVNLMILMDGGNNYGSSYMDPPQNGEHTVDTTNGLRQIFTPANEIVVDQLSVFASGDGTLQVNLNDKDTTIATWDVETSGDTHNVIDTGEITLAKGKDYSLEFMTTSGSVQMLTFREGSVGIGYLYPPEGSWSDGWAQVNDGGGWTDSFFEFADVAGVAFRTVEAG